MKRRVVGCHTCWLCCPWPRRFWSPPSAAAEPKPNIVFILADDLGYTDVGCFGSKYYETPNIDRMAAAGNAVHRRLHLRPELPADAGRADEWAVWPADGDLHGRLDRPVRLEEPAAPAGGQRRVAAARRRSRWPSRSRRRAMPPPSSANGTSASRGRIIPPAAGSTKRSFRWASTSTSPPVPKTPYPPGTYLADFLTDKAVDFITRHKDDPFFLCLHHFGVHSPHDAKKDLIAKFKDKAPSGGHHDPTYAAMIASVDESVGRVLKTLDDLGLSEKTLVIFTSDNGGVGGYAREGIGRAGGITDNAPLRGGKGMLYEGGVRVAYVFRMPGKIAAGTTCNQPINSVDLYPTLLELAGAKAPEGYPLDGMSYREPLDRQAGRPSSTARRSTGISRATWAQGQGAGGPRRPARSARATGS